MNGAINRGTPLAWSKFKAVALATTFLCTGGVSASAMDLKTALEITLHTNPEIAESAANRRAIDFEYEQAKRLSNPSIIVEGRAGPEWVDSRTTRLLGNDEDVLWGRQASITMQQSLYDFGRNSSERERQASRVDAAAHRVWERSELVGLDVVQSYFDILRLREILNYADENVSFHEQKANEISRTVTAGTESPTDARQSRERLIAARVSRNETEEAMEIAESTFTRIVGRGIGRASTPPSIVSDLPGSLDDALRQARKSNPTLHIARGDLATARAEYRKAKADNKPSLSLEVAGRAGEDIGGFRDTTNDVRAQLVFRHEFRGGIKSSVVQENLNWVDERRQKLLRLERSVDGLVREAWATKTRTSERRIELAKQVEEGTSLVDSYERERKQLETRTLLDVLDAQASLFQAKTAHTTAKHAEMYAQYRLLASTGSLLKALKLDPRHEANANLSDIEGVSNTPEADAEPRRYPKHYNKTMGGTNSWSPAIAFGTGIDDESLATLDVKPVTKQWASRPGDAPKPARTAVVEMPAIANVASAKPEAKIQKLTETEVQIPSPIVKAEPVVNAPVIETKVVEKPAPRIYGNMVTVPSVQSAPAPIIVAEPVVQAAAVVAAPTIVEEPAVQEAVIQEAAPTIIAKPSAAPTLMAETVTVPQEPILGLTGADRTQAILSDAPLFEAPNSVAEDESLPIGVPVEVVDAERFAELKLLENARIYWDMGAVLHDNKLYLLK